MQIVILKVKVLNVCFIIIMFKADAVKPFTSLTLSDIIDQSVEQQYILD